ncbi:MAG: helix-turn-helix transcriptional regulator [Ruminococcaceae bacterium]|nr:helix-turn-helix transcriptional regulator [Oscillospiraceae bacterium]
MPEEMSFGARLKNYRKKKKMTQAQLAKILGKSPSTVYGYESDQILPSYDTVCLISTALSVRVTDLMDLKETLPDEDGMMEYYKLYFKRWQESRQ